MGERISEGELVELTRIAWESQSARFDHASEDIFSEGAARAIPVGQAGN